MSTWTERAAEAAAAMRPKMSVVPRIGLILGTGLGDIAAQVDRAASMSTTEIPHFPPSTVSGHAGRLLVGTFDMTPIAVLSGRIHGYEGYAPALLGFPVRVLHALGVRTLITTNAAGAINSIFSPGDVMVIEDHISFPSLASHSPLVSRELEPGLPRFVDLTAAYSPEMRRLADAVALDALITVRHGVYAMVGGPNFETPAEVRFLRLIGADAVGMSTVPEVIVARQLGMSVLGLSVMSNLAAGLPGALLDHGDVMAAMGRAAPSVGRLIRGVVSRLSE